MGEVLQSFARWGLSMCILEPGVSFTRRVLLIKLNTMLLGLVPGGSSLLGGGPFLNSSPDGCSPPEEPVPSSARFGPCQELVCKRV